MEMLTVFRPEIDRASRPATFDDLLMDSAVDSIVVDEEEDEKLTSYTSRM